MNDTKRQSRVMSADMSPQAIEQRLRVVHEMNELCAALGKARLVMERTFRDHSASQDVLATPMSLLPILAVRSSKVGGLNSMPEA